MKKLYFPIFIFIIVLITNVSCKKQVEEKQQDLVVAAMTNGKWKMTWFKENNVSIPDFDGYEFQYYSDYTVDATGGGTTKKGTWGGDAATMTTNANFPSSAGNPLLKINGTWKILRNSWTFVEAEQVNGSETKTMRLDKK